MSKYIHDELGMLIVSIKKFSVTEPILYFEREDGSWMRTMFADGGVITTPSLHVPDEDENLSLYQCMQCDLEWKIIERLVNEKTGEFEGELCEGQCNWCKRIEHSVLLINFYPNPLKVNNQLLIGNVGRFDLTHCSRCADIIQNPIIITPVEKSIPYCIELCDFCHNKIIPELGIQPRFEDPKRNR